MKGIDIWNVSGIGAWGDGEVVGNVATLIAVNEAEGDFEPKRIPVGDFVKAARTALTMYPNCEAAPYIRDALRQNDPGMLDAEAGDIIVQVAAFGEIVYD